MKMTVLGTALAITIILSIRMCIGITLQDEKFISQIMEQRKFIPQSSEFVQDSFETTPHPNFGGYSEENQQEHSRKRQDLILQSSIGKHLQKEVEVFQNNSQRQYRIPPYPMKHHRHWQTELPLLLNHKKQIPDGIIQGKTSSVLRDTNEAKKLDVFEYIHHIQHLTTTTDNYKQYNVLTNNHQGRDISVLSDVHQRKYIFSPENTHQERNVSVFRDHNQKNDNSSNQQKKGLLVLADFHQQEDLPVFVDNHHRRVPIPRFSTEQRRNSNEHPQPQGDPVSFKQDLVEIADTTPADTHQSKLRHLQDVSPHDLVQPTPVKKQQSKLRHQQDQADPIPTDNRQSELRHRQDLTEPTPVGNSKSRIGHRQDLSKSTELFPAENRQSNRPATWSNPPSVPWVDDPPVGAGTGLLPILYLLAPLVVTAMLMPIGATVITAIVMLRNHHQLRGSDNKPKDEDFTPVYKAMEKNLLNAWSKFEEAIAKYASTPSN